MTYATKKKNYARPFIGRALTYGFYKESAYIERGGSIVMHPFYQDRRSEGFWQQKKNIL